MKKAKQTMFRQGDVLIELIKEVPAGIEKQKSATRVVLALGEATGHHHCLETDVDDPADWWKKSDDEQYVTTTKPSKVTHQEHGTIDLPKGTFKVSRQRRYTPAGIRNVAD